jgi:hypothetical protein
MLKHGARAPIRPPVQGYPTRAATSAPSSRPRSASAWATRSMAGQCCGPAAPPRAGPAPPAAAGLVQMAKEVGEIAAPGSCPRGGFVIECHAHKSTLCEWAGDAHDRLPPRTISVARCSGRRVRGAHHFPSGQGRKAGGRARPISDRRRPSTGPIVGTTSVRRWTRQSSRRGCQRAADAATDIRTIGPHK